MQDNYFLLLLFIYFSIRVFLANTDALWDRKGVEMAF